MRVTVTLLFVAFAIIPCNLCYVAGTNNKMKSVLSCIKRLGFSKCITAYGVWAAESELTPRKNSFFSWNEFMNESDEVLYRRLCDDTEKLLRHRSLSMNIGDRYLIVMKSTNNKTLNFDIVENKNITEGRSSMKKMTKMFYKTLPMLILPGLIMSAILPFFLPTLKMATVATGMLNNMALTGAVFTLLRNNAFNDNNYQKKVIYVNAGYGKKKYEPLKFDTLEEAPSETFDDIAGPNFETQFSTEVTHDVKDYHLVGVDPSTGISYPFNEDWLKNTVNMQEKKKNVQIIGEVPSDTYDWRKPNLKWAQHIN